MIGTLAKHKAEAEGWDDALMYDWRGQVAEGTGANICFVFDGEVHTPAPDCFLDSITRRAVTALAGKHQIKVVERAIMPEELAHATEAFLVGTAAEVTPVRQIGSHSYTPSRITDTLVTEYDRLVRRPPAEGGAAHRRLSAGEPGQQRRQQHQPGDAGAVAVMRAGQGAGGEGVGQDAGHDHGGQPGQCRVAPPAEAEHHQRAGRPRA